MTSSLPRPNAPPISSGFAVRAPVARLGHGSEVFRRIACALLLAGCGAGHMTPDDQAMLAAEKGEEVNCVELYKPDASTIDQCRQQVRARFDMYWNAQFDGGAK